MLDLSYYVATIKYTEKHRDVIARIKDQRNIRNILVVLDIVSEG